MIHDYSGPAGPIEQKRFWWFVGESWAADFERAVDRDPFLGIPSFMLGMALGSGAMQAQLQDIARQVVERDSDTATRIKRHYESVNPTEIAALFGARPARKPRVLLLTTLFSTVLQYSTRDSAEAFDRIGWESRVLIEPSPAHRLYQIAIRKVVDEFKPDLIFQIDHLRYEHGEMFPAKLPFVCWVQDHLPNLQNKVAGPSVTDRDFVLTDAGPVYSATFGYPPRQLIGLAKLTRGQEGSAEESAECSVLSAEKKMQPSEGQAVSLDSALSTQHSALSAALSTQHSALSSDDLVFVSNASHLPEQLVDEKGASYKGSDDGRALLVESGRRLIRVYDEGGSVPTWFGLLDFVRAVRRELMLQVPDRELESFSAWLFHPLNNALYRHQALLWAADAADDMGLTLAVYGKGWERHPQLGRYARGPVEYGAALDELSRRSRFNLQIVPFLCLHQRLLDGLVAGGFYLIRSHPADRACAALLDFLNEKLGKNVRTLSSARSAVPIALRRQLEQLVQGCVPSVVTTDKDDPVEIVRSWEEIGLLVPGKPVLSHLDETTFGNATELRQRMARFIADPAARDRVLAAQRKDMLERFTYEAGLRRVTARMHQLLDETARSAGRAAA
jgi:glycosyltransferase involved in cell wall biosynthesis